MKTAATVKETIMRWFAETKQLEEKKEVQGGQARSSPAGLGGLSPWDSGGSEPLGRRGL